MKRFVAFSLVQLYISFLFQAEDSVKNFFPDRVFELDKLLKVNFTLYILVMFLVSDSCTHVLHVCGIKTRIRLK